MDQVFSSTEGLEILLISVKSKGSPKSPLLSITNQSQENLQFKFSQGLIQKSWSLTSKEQQHFIAVFEKFHKATKEGDMPYKCPFSSRTIHIDPSQGEPNLLSPSF